MNALSQILMFRHTSDYLIKSREGYQTNSVEIWLRWSLLDMVRSYMLLP